MCVPVHVCPSSPKSYPSASSLLQKNWGLEWHQWQFVPCEYTKRKNINWSASNICATHPYQRLPLIAPLFLEVQRPTLHKQRFQLQPQHWPRATLSLSTQGFPRRAICKHKSQEQLWRVNLSKRIKSQDQVWPGEDFMPWQGRNIAVNGQRSTVCKVRS